jgi:maltooligosyltrehalose trehalohydrolase
VQLAQRKRGEPGEGPGVEGGEVGGQRHGRPVAGGERAEGRHGRVLDLYRRLIRLRRTDPVWRSAGRAALAAEAWGSVLAVHRWSDHGQRLLLCNLGPDPAALQTLPASHWRRFTTDRPDPTILIASGDLPPDLRTLPPHTAVVLA